MLVDIDYTRWSRIINNKQMIQNDYNDGIITEIYEDLKKHL